MLLANEDRKTEANLVSPIARFIISKESLDEYISQETSKTIQQPIWEY